MKKIICAFMCACLLIVFVTKNLSAIEEIPVCTINGDQIKPVVFNNKIAWIDHRLWYRNAIKPSLICVYDTINKIEFLIPVKKEPLSLAMDADKIIYDAKDGEDSNIYMLDLKQFNFQIPTDAKEYISSLKDLSRDYYYDEKQNIVVEYDNANNRILRVYYARGDEPGGYIQVGPAKWCGPKGCVLQ